MSYHENWQEGRRRHKENHDNNQRWEGGNTRSGYGSSGYWNDDEFKRSGNQPKSQHRNENEENNRGNERHERNPNWDANAPYSSRYNFNDYVSGNNESRDERDSSFEAREEKRFLNRKHSMQGLTDPQYGDPRFSDRQRRGANGGSSDSYERGNYGDYPIYGSSGRRFSENQQENVGSHIQDWNADYDPDNEISSRWKPQHTEVSHRGKGPKNYKRSDSRIKEDVCDALYDHHFVDASELEVEVKDGNVILSGSVDSRYAKRDAETAIDYISGVENVENRIHVKSQSFNSMPDVNAREDQMDDIKTRSEATSKEQNGKASV